MTYITQKMDLVMIDFHIEYPGAEKYTSLIPQHLFPHKFVHQEERMGVYKKMKERNQILSVILKCDFSKKNAKARGSFLYLYPEKKMLGTHSATSLLSVK